MHSPKRAARHPGSTLRGAVALFFNFMMIVLAYYQVKAASRSLLIEFGGVEVFPYIWIGSAFVLLAFIGVYNRLVGNCRRVRVVTGSLVVCAALLSLFWLARGHATIGLLYAFYIFVDIFSVVLIEQFWSLSNSVMRLKDGENSYWFVGTGGILGGVAGGALASLLLRYTPMQTADLLLSCAAMLLVCAGMTSLIARSGLFDEVPDEERVTLDDRGLTALLGNRYLLLVAVIVCFSQLVEPIIEYQFLSEVSGMYPERDARTQVISEFFSLLSLASMLVNLAVTPVVHRQLGAIAGLAVQPLVVAIASAAYMVHATLTSAAVMKISDRGLSYSINRASKELLYIPIDALTGYRVKAWIDMLGYRMFKVLGSGLILLAGLWIPAGADATYLGWLTLGICGAWLFTIALLGAEYRKLIVPQRT